LAEVVLRAMDLRLRSLERLDSRAVALPHGTEVVTRVDRIVGERRVPQGSVGRVTKVDGADCDIAIVGVGVVRYSRGELSPRRVGQVLFAHRRADAWDALRPCVILEATVGSHAWGLADDGSDVDHRGVFALPFTWTQGLVAPPEDLVSADGSSTYWAAGKAIRHGVGPFLTREFGELTPWRARFAQHEQTVQAGRCSGRGAERLDEGRS
jgi:RNA repair pathway DNA polymerase beta family